MEVSRSHSEPTTTINITNLEKPDVRTAETGQYTGFPIWDLLPSNQLAVCTGDVKGAVESRL